MAMPGMANVSTRLRISRLPMPVVKMFTPWRHMPMAAAAIGMYRQGVNIFTTGIGSLLILNLVLTFAIPGIAIGGHLGGAVGGAICGLAMLGPRWKPSPVWVTYVVPIAVGVGSVVASVIVVA